MTIGEFTIYLQTHSCDIEPCEGRNLTGIGLRITKRDPITGRILKTHHLQLYHGGEVSKTSVFRCCTALGIPFPF